MPDDIEALRRAGAGGLDRASLPSRLVIGWVLRLMLRGVRRPLQLSDLPPTPRAVQLDAAVVSAWWAEELANPHKPGKPSLIRGVCAKAARGWFWPGVLLCLCSGLLGTVVKPLVMQQMIRSLDVGEGYTTESSVDYVRSGLSLHDGGNPSRGPRGALPGSPPKKGSVRGSPSF